MKHRAPLCFALYALGWVAVGCAALGDLTSGVAARQLDAAARVARASWECWRALEAEQLAACADDACRTRVRTSWARVGDDAAALIAARCDADPAACAELRSPCSPSAGARVDECSDTLTPALMDAE